MIRLTTALSVTAILLLTLSVSPAQDAKQLPQLDAGKIFKKLDANSDGKVSKEEFKKLTEVAQEVFKDRAELLDKAFGRLDANADGSLSEEEFAKFGALAKRVGGIAAPDQGGLAGVLKDAEATFKKLDADKDGKLSKDEFAKLAEEAKLPQLKDRQEQIFGRLDADSNGSLSVEEFKKLSGMAQKLTQRLKKADK